MDNKKEPLLEKKYIELKNIPYSDFSEDQGINCKKNSTNLDYYQDSKFLDKLWFSWVNNILKVIFLLTKPESKDY